MKMKLTKWIGIYTVVLSSTLSANAQNDHPKAVQVVYEVFSLSMSDAVAARRGGSTDEVLYKKMLDGLESGKVKQEKFLSMRGRSGQKGQVNHASEYIYATEYEPPELPNSVGGGIIPKTSEEEKKPEPKDPNVPDLKSTTAVFPVTPAMPRAFETRIIGDNMEFEAMLGADPKYLNLRLSASHVNLFKVDSWGKGVAEAKMPRFSNQGTTSSITQVSGVPTLIGTVSPSKEVQGEDGDRVWFAFVTSWIIEVK